MRRPAVDTTRRPASPGRSGGRMLPVSVLVLGRGREVPLDSVSDPSVVAPLKQLAGEVGKRLAKVQCPEHKQGPTEVRIHVDAAGDADIRYESCCLKLRDAVGRVL